MSYKRIVDEQTKLILHRWFYCSVGILTMIPIILLTLVQIRNIKINNNEFSFYILLLFHSGCVIFSIILTALFCRTTDALLTTLNIILLSIYTGIHFYIHFLFNYHNLNEDFTIITVRLGFVLIMLIILLPWTNIMTYSYRMITEQEKICSREATFSWLLNLDSILMISLLILNIRNLADFDQYQLLILSVGISLVFLWLTIGKILANKKSHNWILWMIFYILILIQIFHLAYITYRFKLEYNILSKTTETSLISLLILTFICGGTNILIHSIILTISFCLFCT